MTAEERQRVLFKVANNLYELIERFDGVYKVKMRILQEFKVKVIGSL